MPYQAPGSDPLRVPKPVSGRAYRWLADDRDRMSGWLLGHGDRPGYKLCRGKTVPETRKICEALGFPETYVDATVNMIKYGRLVLADIPASERALRNKELLQQASDIREANIDGFNDKFQRRGVRAAVREMEEFEDRKRFAAEKDVSVSLAGLNVPSSSHPGAAEADSA